MNRSHIALLLLIQTAHVAAEVTWSDAAGFESKNTVTIDAEADEVYATLIEVGRWWNPSHSWSGDSNNMTIDARAGGCFCEKLPDGGSVQHLGVTYVKPGALLRMRGALGPLQEFPLEGAQTWALGEAEEGGTTLTVTYRVSGHVEGGLTNWAPAVDGVHLEQLTRLKRLIETGKPGE